MKLVPLEPTEEMVAAGELRWLELQYPHAQDFASNPDMRERIRQVLRSALYARPALTVEQIREIAERVVTASWDEMESREQIVAACEQAIHEALRGRG